jgi:N-acetylglucosamine kinase-like BadF-type ATPase
LATERLAERVVVGTDVEAAFHDAFGDGPGILLIAGTGSIAWARDAAGSVVRVGGWGEGLGDEGSGFAIGLAALRAIAHAEDGRGPETALRDPILEHLALSGCDELVPWTSRAKKSEVAALVPLVSLASSRGDPIAKGILETAVSDLMAHLRAALERTAQWAEPPELVLWGGLLRDGAPLHEAVVQAVSRYPVRLASGDVDPSTGAAKMALAALAEMRGEG